MRGICWCGTRKGWGEFLPYGCPVEPRKEGVLRLWGAVLPKGKGAQERHEDFLVETK